MQTFELVEIDPETGDEDQTLSIQPATWAKIKAEFDTLIQDMQEDWEEGGQWSWIMIRPAR